MPQWRAEQVEALAALVAAAAPEEDLTADELLAACFERPGAVLTDPGGAGAVAVEVHRDESGQLVAAVGLLAVHPAHRRRGLGTALLAEAEVWAAGRGAARIELGGTAPFSIWMGAPPGSAVAELARAAGYDMQGGSGSVIVPSSFRADAPAGVVVRRAIADEDVSATTLAVAGTWPASSDEVARALDHGTCHVAVVERSTDETRGGGPPEVLGVGCHSVTRAGWVGPLVVRPARRREGIGHALLGHVCRDLMIADFPAAVVPDVTGADVTGFLAAAGGAGGPSHERWVKDLDVV